MSKNDFEYEYDYHNLAEDADYMDEDECYYDDGTDEPWSVEPEDSEIKDEYKDYMTQYDSYYHDVIDELEDE